MADRAIIGKPRSTESPGGTPMGWIGVSIVALYLVVVTVAVVHGLTVLWPPDARQEGIGDRLERLEAAIATEDQEPRGEPAPVPPRPQPTDAREHRGSAAGSPTCREGEAEAPYLQWTFCLYPEERLFVIVMLAGALGGLVHSLRSFYWYLGNRALYSSWAGMYVTLPVVGAGMAVIFYLVIRGGFTPSDSNFEGTNPFGFAAMAVLVGMFTEQAALRLKEVAETVFTKAQKGKDHAGTPTVAQVEPDRGPVAGGTEVTINGTGFKEGVTVQFGGKPATDVEVKDESTIEAKTPEATVAGPVVVEVFNPGGPRGRLPGGFTYE